MTKKVVERGPINLMTVALGSCEVRCLALEPMDDIAIGLFTHALKADAPRCGAYCHLSASGGPVSVRCITLLWRTE